MKSVEQMAIESIILVIKNCYGYDFSNYSLSSLKRRLLYHQQKKSFKTLADMLPHIINEPSFFEELLVDLSITTTELFRDPEFYKSFRANILPKLETYAFFKIWHAGCATGEEIYSMSILLYEHGLLSRAQLYGTDFNPFALEASEKGVYALENLQVFKKNYALVAGLGQIENYFTCQDDYLLAKDILKDSMTFDNHNLVTDGPFIEVEVVVCRNVLIYFDSEFRNKALDLFQASLVDYGFLCLGAKEMTDHKGFKCIDKANSIYQKVPL